LFSLEINPQECVALLGKLKCLDALGRWDEAVKLCTDNLEILRDNSTILEKAAVIGARAAWSLNEWGLLESLVEQLPTESTDASIMRAVLNIHAEDYEAARQHIDSSRKKLSENLITTLSESYSRAYVPLIKVQQCSELEEVIEFKMLLKSSGDSLVSFQVQSEDDVDKDDPVSSSSSFKIHQQNLQLLTTPRVKGPSTPGTERLRSRSSSLRNVTSAANVDTAQLSPMQQPSPAMFGRNVSTDGLTRGASSASISGGGAGGATAIQSSTNMHQDINRRKLFLADKWQKRLKGCKSSGRAAIGVWKNLLDVRRLVLSETEDIDVWLEFSTLCRHGGNLDLAERVLRLIHEKNESFGYRSNSFDEDMLGNPYFASAAAFTPSSLADCKVRFAVLRLQWALGRRTEAVDSLFALIEVMSSSSLELKDNSASTTAGARTPTPSAVSTTVTSSSLYLDCLLKLGQWRLALLPPSVSVDAETRRAVLNLYSKATVMNPGNYRAWHEWGLANYRAAEEMRERGGGRRRHASWEDNGAVFLPLGAGSLVYKYRYLSVALLLMF